MLNSWNKLQKAARQISGRRIKLLLLNFIERAVIANTSYFKNIFANLQRNTWILAITMFINRSGSMVTLIIISEILAMAFMMNYVLSNSPTDRLEQYSSLYSIAFGISIIATPLIGLGIA